MLDVGNGSVGGTDDDMIIIMIGAFGVTVKIEKEEEDYYEKGIEFFEEEEEDE